MTIGIYGIRHISSGKIYIGKSIDIEKRWWTHRWQLKQSERPHSANRHLWNAVKKHGVAAFEFIVIEVFETVDELAISDAELSWMDFYFSCEREFGYNLRRDSSTKMIVHDETRAQLSVSIAGDNNPNFGNKWTDAQRKKASLTFLRLYAAGRMKHSDERRQKASEFTKEFWKDAEKKKRMAQKVAAVKEIYDFHQFTREGVLIRRWRTVKDIVAFYPTFKWQCIYDVCSGRRKTYKGFSWKKVIKEEVYEREGLIANGTR